MNTRKITGIVIHCAATPNGRWHDVFDIDKWHQERGFKRSDEFRRQFNPRLLAIGYHFIIYTNGAVATGRSLSEIGAHAQGFNSRSLGVCLIGTDKFTIEQWDSLRDNVRASLKLYPEARIVGHRDLPNVHKECPGFDVKDWLENDMRPRPGRILEQAA
ncbi:N-acetylmuramoyl-L-alanine amidase [Nitrosomonas sp. Nm166]|uniref:N-acetylmuramoyl-L-alanine amidase n=1 Tax=Nitrosomonas sp. Nm166 TaxID=1881054 RepID=UPI0008EB36E6|nr:N-acetylmuramoyl-L-alanine amidase [Nitrosomonas sp. Nm166]SFF13730.1 N-acetylmuramoyl-L-alanine amidase [Nitrosomonas sp. Nm166]